MTTRTARSAAPLPLGHFSVAPLAPFLRLKIRWLGPFPTGGFSCAAMRACSPSPTRAPDSGLQFCLRTIVPAAHTRVFRAGQRCRRLSRRPAAKGVFMLTSEQLHAIMPLLPAAKRATLFPFLTTAVAEFGIDAAARTAAFLAQLAHESAQF